MSVKAMLVDPGVGEKAAPVGTEAWAQHMRLHLTNMVDRIAERPKDFHDELVFFHKHRAWTLLKDDKGLVFPTFQAFCEFRKPWGLGRPLSDIEPLLKAAVGERAYQLVAVAPSKQGERVDLAEETSGHDVRKSGGQEKEEVRLRAVLRAPAEVQDLYRAGVIGQVDAAKLGPTKQTPETAAKIRAAVNEAVAIVEAEKPETPKAKRDVKRKVNAKIREVLGAPAPRSFDALLDRIAKLSSEDRATLVCEVVAHLDGVHIHRVREAIDAREEG